MGSIGKNAESLKVEFWGNEKHFLLRTREWPTPSWFFQEVYGCNPKLGRDGWPEYEFFPLIDLWGAINVAESELSNRSVDNTLDFSLDECRAMLLGWIHSNQLETILRAGDVSRYRIDDTFPSEHMRGDRCSVFAWSLNNRAEFLIETPKCLYEEITTDATCSIGTGWFKHSFDYRWTVETIDYEPLPYGYGYAFRYGFTDRAYKCEISDIITPISREQVMEDLEEYRGEDLYV